MAEHRVFAEGVEGDPPEVVASGTGELAEVLRGVRREVEVGLRELVPSVATGDDHDADREDGGDEGDAAQEPRVPRDVEYPSRQPSPPPFQASQPGEGEQGQRRSGEQDQEHGHALVDHSLVGHVIGEAVAVLDGEDRGHDADRGGGERAQQPEPIPREGEQADDADDQGQ